MGLSYALDDYTHTMTHLYIASDHAAYGLKEKVKTYLTSKYPDYELHDLGCHSEESVHYPEYGKAVADKVAGTDHKGIVLCGSGIGISIAANRVRGARAALCMTAQMAALSREHNNANILALGARLIDEQLAYEMIDAFMTTDFAGGRHQLRVEMLDG